MGLCTTTKCNCSCTGNEQSTLPFVFSTIQPYRGELYMYGYVPDMELDETIISEGVMTSFVSFPNIEWSRKVRSWVREAAQYHGVPPILIALILQHENGKNAPKWKRIGQSMERFAQTTLADIEEMTGRKLPSKLGSGAAGSTGLCNMSRATFRMGAKYIEDTYCKPVIPDRVRYSTRKSTMYAPFYTNESTIRVDIKTNSAGSSIHGDLYHCAAHLRQLIDIKTGKTCHSSELSREQCKAVIAGYNGSGSLAEKYGNDGLNYLDAATCGQKILYFYE